ncbi:MAG: formylmethanofuran dehydrogenase [Desulfohalobiaceae bacterium]|nr:formylmethanofuran dehydrogenase [Desulfohalobiaceae bacterium]
MKAQDIRNSEDFKRCEAFHGHICPGLSIGYKAARLAMAKLDEIRAEDEEMVAVVETDACSADAVQVLTGCTFGKGNFHFRDHGKMALTLFSRATGKGVRVSMKPGAFEPDPEHRDLLQKVMQGQAGEGEKEQFQELHLQRSCDVLDMPEEQLFDLQEVEEELPARARIEPSEACSRCGEPTMRSKLEMVEGKALCRGCLSVI